MMVFSSYTHTENTLQPQKLIKIFSVFAVFGDLKIIYIYSFKSRFFVIKLLFCNRTLACNTINLFSFLDYFHSQPETVPSRQLTTREQRECDVISKCM